MAAPELAIVGRVRRAHGIRGELVVEALTDAPDAIFASGRRVLAGTVDGDPSPGAPELRVRSSRPFKGGFIVAFEGIADRNAAELWRGRYFLVPRDELAPLAEDEVYLHDLLGSSVFRDADGEPLGDVIDVYELPQGLVLDVQLATGTVLIPFRPEVIRRIDRETRRLFVDPPEGLLE